jgi:exopolysaccharide production protein ExoQ
MSATLTALPLPATKTYARMDDRFLFRRVRTWWLLLALCIMAQENSNIFLVASRATQKLNQRTYTPSAALLFFTLLLWAIAGALIFTRLRLTLRTMLQQKAVLPYVALALLSTVWSQDPQLTFRRAIILCFLCGFAWLFASSYSPPDQMRLLLTTGVVLASASIAWAVLFPQYGLDSGGEWRGIFGQKNQLGHSMLFLFSCLAFRPIANGRRLVVTAMQAMLPIGVIILAQSMHSVVLAVLLIAVRFYGPFFRRIRKEQRPFLVFMTAFGILAIAFGREMILVLLGRDATLTGRTHEWAILIPFAFRHFWLGYGYQAFWTGTGDSLSAIATLGASIHGADSGYLDNALQLGVLGVSLFLLIMLVALRDFVRLYRRGSVPLAGYWYVGIVLITLVGSIVEGLFSGPGGASVFMFLVACAGLRILCSGNSDVAVQAS